MSGKRSKQKTVWNYYLPGVFSTASFIPPKRIQVCKDFFLGAIGETEDFVHRTINPKLVLNDNQANNDARFILKQPVQVNTSHQMEPRPSRRKIIRTKSLAFLNKIKNVVKSIIHPSDPDSLLNDVKAIINGKI